MAFAEIMDVEARLGRPLTPGEQTTVTYLLDGASAMVVDSAGKAETDIDPVPAILKFVTVELACRALANPNSLDSLSEGLGAFQYAARFREAGLMLTPDEELRVRRAVHGVLAGSGRADSLADDIADPTNQLLPPPPLQPL